MRAKAVGGGGNLHDLIVVDPVRDRISGPNTPKGASGRVEGERQQRRFALSMHGDRALPAGRRVTQRVRGARPAESLRVERAELREQDAHLHGIRLLARDGPARPLLLHGKAFAMQTDIDCFDRVRGDGHDAVISPRIGLPLDQVRHGSPPEVRSVGLRRADERRAVFGTRLADQEGEARLCGGPYTKRPGGAVEPQTPEGRRADRRDVPRGRVTDCLEELAPLPRRCGEAVRGPDAGGHLCQPDRVQSVQNGDGVRQRRRQCRQHQGAPHLVRAMREERREPPEREEDDHRDGETPELEGAHAAAWARGRYGWRVRARRRARRSAPKSATTSGTPMMLPYRTAPRSAALVNARGGGVRSLDRMLINASSCASQSTAFSTKTAFSGEFWAK